MVGVAAMPGGTADAASSQQQQEQGEAGSAARQSAASIRRSIQQDGAANIIVNLDIGEDAELSADRGSIGARAETIRATQDAVLTAMAAAANDAESSSPADPPVNTASPTIHHRFDHVPALALTISSEPELDALLAHPSVTIITDDMGGTGMLGTSVPLIAADARHAAGNRGDGVTVAVLDTGADLDHPDLADDILANQACFGDNNGAIDGVGFCPNGSDRQTGAGAAEDDAGHGTHVTGIVTSAGTVSAPGAAPGAEIVPIKVTDDCTFSGCFYRFSEILAALDWIITNDATLGVDVINMSLGTSATYAGDCDTTFPAAAATISSLEALGITTFASAGNDGLNEMGAPACLSDVISVGASDNADGPYVSTNSNTSTDIFAPGVGILSLAIGGGTTTATGTSMASPHAAGCAALLIESGDATTPGAIETRLEASSFEVTDGAGLTFPRVDCSPDTTAPPVDVSTALIIDASGSMRTNDPDSRRLDAGNAYLNVSLPDDEVGVVQFTAIPTVLSEALRVGPNRSTLSNAIGNIGANNGTNIGAGLDAGCGVLQRAGGQQRAAILLTDGIGAYDNQAQCFADRGWKIYVFGLSDNVDEGLLEQIATDTGGTYTQLDEITNLVCEFQQIRALIATGTRSNCQPTAIINPGQLITLTERVVEALRQITFTNVWGGSDIEMTVTSPSGRTIDRTTSADDLVIDVGATFETFTLANPEQGDWTIELFGADIPPEGELFTFSTVQIPVESPPPGGDCDNLTPTIVGTDGNDRLIGTPGPDIIAAGDGDDRIYALGGDDVVCAGEGDDYVSLGEGADQAFGENGNDYIAGDGGADKLDGGTGEDTLSGGAGDDELAGGPDDDLLRGGGGDDTLDGQAGDDKLEGQPGNDALNGGADNDSLFGAAGDDELFGGPGNDLLRGGNNDDKLRGDEGDDICNGNIGVDTAEPSCEVIFGVP